MDHEGMKHQRNQIAKNILICSFTFFCIWRRLSTLTWSEWRLCKLRLVSTRRGHICISCGSLCHACPFAMSGSEMQIRLSTQSLITFASFCNRQRCQKWPSSGPDASAVCEVLDCQSVSSRQPRTAFKGTSSLCVRARSHQTTTGQSASSSLRSTWGEVDSP